MSKENKLPPVAVDSREAAEAALNEMARLKSLIAEHERAEAEEAGQRGAVESLYARQEKAVEKWAVKDRKTWPGKSIALKGGTVSFQVSPGKVVTLKGIARTIADAVLLLAKSRRAWAAKLLRTKPAVLNGEFILQEFNDQRLTNEQLAEVGLKVEKPEVCKVEVYG